MVYRVVLALRFTRISCRPLGARAEFDRYVEAQSEHDAMRQACLCLDAELEGIIADVNTINVAELLVDVLTVELSRGAGGVLWNASPYPATRQVPGYLTVRDRRG